MDELTGIALVGTQRSKAAATIDPDHPAEALLAALAGEDREELLLLRAGVRAVFEQCGRRPLEDIPPLPAAPAESRPVAPNRLARLLRQVIEEQMPEALFIEACQALDAVGMLLPFELLPLVLEKMCKGKLRISTAVLGNRGRWLAELNPRWSKVLGRSKLDQATDLQSLQAVWEEGTIDDRCEALRRLRKIDPATARRWLAETLPTERPEIRAKLLATLHVGLSDEDEPFLESQLDDRSQQVRQAAASLLVLLPGSALAARMLQRADAMLVALPNKSRRQKRLRLECRPPEKIDRTWTRDGVPAQARGKKGKRAAWVETVLSLVPPGHWCDRFSATPEDLVAAIAEDNFAEEVLTAWVRAAGLFAQQNPENEQWVDALWAYWLAKFDRKREGPLADAAKQALGKLSLTGSAEKVQRLVGPLLPRYVRTRPGVLWSLFFPMESPPWKKEFTSHYFASVREALQRFKPSYDMLYWLGTMTTAARAIPPEMIGEAEELVGFAAGKRAIQRQRFAAEAIEQCATILQFRAEFHAELRRAASATNLEKDS